MFTASNSRRPAGKPCFTSESLAYAGELAIVRRWLACNVPAGRGFRIEDKQIALGLHYRLADPKEAAPLCDRFAQLVSRETPRLKLVFLKMLAEAMPRVASKARALVAAKTLMPKSYVTAYIGDDTTDEDAFAALGQDDIGVLAGARHASLAGYWVDGPAAVARELRSLVAA